MEIEAVAYYVRPHGNYTLDVCPEFLTAVLAAFGAHKLLPRTKCAQASFYVTQSFRK